MLLAEVKELDRDAPDYDRALIELAAFLQRIAIVQIVPEAALQDEEFDSDSLARLARAISPEDVQLYYQIALNGRRDLSLAPDPRMGFEMTLLRMLAFRPDAASVQGGAGSRAAPAGAAAANLSNSGASPTAAARFAVPGAGGPATHAISVAVEPAAGPEAVASVAAARTAAGAEVSRIDADTWPAVVEAANLSGMARLFALNCVPASFEHNLLVLKLDQATADRRTRPIEDKLVQSLSKYLGRDIRMAFETAQSALDTPVRQRQLQEQERVVRAVAAFEADPTVKGLRERFGADVDAASVKPANQP
jgi:DNA polymerase-3 subunit gamma/tau